LQASGLAFEWDDPAVVATVTEQIHRLAQRQADGVLPVERLHAGELTTFLIEPVQIRMALYAPPNIDNHQALTDCIETFSPG
jgi:hypothetical protein